MTSRQSQERRLLDRMEACRPHGADLDDPAMAELAARLTESRQWQDAFDRLQKLDVMLAGAFHDVPVPADEAERILARLAETAAQDPAQQSPLGQVVQAVVTEAGVVAADAQPHAATRRFRRGLWGAVAAVGVGLAAALALLLSPRPEPYTANAVLENAVSFFNNETPVPGQLIAEAAPPSSWPYSPAVQAYSSARWRKVDGFLGTSGVAYDLTTPAGVHATLYVVKRTVADLGDALPLRPALESANCCVSAWQDRSLLYVLVVRGDAAAYESFLDVPRWPVT